MEYEANRKLIQEKSNLFLKDLAGLLRKHDANLNIEVKRDYTEACGNLTFALDDFSCGHEISCDIAHERDIYPSDIDKLIKHNLKP